MQFKRLSLEAKGPGQLGMLQSVLLENSLSMAQVLLIWVYVQLVTAKMILEIARGFKLMEPHCDASSTKETMKVRM